MALDTHSYDNVVHNTLAKVLVLDLVTSINDFAREDGSAAHRDLKMSGVDALAVNGSAFHILCSKAPVFPRNLNDLDTMVVGNARFDPTYSKVAFSGMFRECAERIGARSSFMERGEGLHESRLLRLSRLVGMKQTHYVTKSFDADMLKAVLAKSEYYRLSADDRTTLQELIDAGQPVEVQLKVDVNALTKRPDLPPLDLDGNEVALQTGHFQGMYLLNWLEQIAQKTRAINTPNRRTPCDVLDSYNCAALAGFSDGIVDEATTERYYRELRRHGSTFNLYNRAIGAMSRQFGLMMGYTQSRYPDVTPQDVEGYRGRFEGLKAQHILHEVPPDTAISHILHAGHVNSNVLLDHTRYANWARAIKHGRSTQDAIQH